MTREFKPTKCRDCGNKLEVAAVTGRNQCELCFNENAKRVRKDLSGIKDFVRY